MKLSRLCILLWILSSSTNIFATITCSDPKLGKVTGNDSLYSFETVVNCKLVDEKINLKALKDAYRDEISNPKSEFKVHSQQNYTDKQTNMQGYKMDVTQSYDTPHGSLAVRADVYLLDDNANKFNMELRSKSISGEGEATNNKSINNKIILTVFPDHADLTSIKTIKVHEPWYVPDFMFFDTVKKELIDASRKGAMQHAKKIAGQQIEAMRK